MPSPRRTALPLLLLALTGVGVAGCSSEDDAPQRADAHLGAFRLPAIYLPPPTPETTSSQRKSPTSASRPRATSAREVPDDTDAPTDAEVAAELKQAFGAGDVVDRAALTPDGLATPPSSAPTKVTSIIQGANQVARKPYVYGGGHGGGPEGLFTDSAYDCSGSVSYALAAAGLVKSPLASGPLMTWGKPGRGKWVTIYANAGHAFMVVAGLRFDTSGRDERDTRWQSGTRSVAGFVARHPAGL